MVLRLLENSILYPAPPKNDGDWQASWLEREEVNFTSADGTRLHAWYCPSPTAETTLLLCHGNGEHVAYMADELHFLRQRLNANVLAFDYRGYGRSEGKPFEDGVLADGEAALQWLAQRSGQPPESIVLFGRSLGGAVAVHLAAQHGARALVLDRTFNSLVDVAASYFPWLPVRLLLRNRFPSADKVQHYRGPLFQVHGTVDEVVPIRFARLLFEASPSPVKQLLVSETLSHNAAWPEEYFAELQSFLSKHPPPSRVR